MQKKEINESSYRKRAKRGSKNPQIYTRTNTIVPERSFSKLYIFLFAIIIGVFVYVALFSPALAIKKINVSGTSYGTMIKEEIATEVQKNLFTKNILFFSAGELSKKLKQNLLIKDISIKKLYPDTLKVDITEREPSLIWEENENKFLVDKDGLAYQEIEGEGGEYQGLPVIKNNLISLNEVGDEVASEEFMDFIKFLIDNFETEIIDKIVLIEINTSRTEITVLTDKNYKVFFDVTKSAASQIKSLSKVKEETKDNGKKLEYIDLRIDTRIFYK